MQIREYVTAHIVDANRFVFHSETDQTYLNRVEAAKLYDELAKFLKMNPHE